MNGFEDILKRAKRAKRAAEDEALDVVGEWHRSERARIAADPDLSISEREYELRQLTMEVGRRANAAAAKAKRDNSAPKLMERDARAALAAKREPDGLPPWR